MMKHVFGKIGNRSLLIPSDVDNVCPFLYLLRNSFHSRQAFNQSTSSSLLNRSQFSFCPSVRSFSSSRKGDDEWNDAWESAWLPEDVSASKNRAPWETDVHFPSPESPSIVLPSEADAETKAFVEDMTENWNERRRSPKNQGQQQEKQEQGVNSLYSVENMKKDYRMKKQRIHAGLWMKEIEKQEEAKLNDSVAGDDIEKLLDTCSDIFDSPNNELDNLDISASAELKNKPDGWETASKPQDGNVWDMTQREEDILLQEFERRTAYCKFQIASFIKTHIFSRRRPIDGWKYMVEVVGPNAQKGKGSSPRLPSLSDPSTQPFKEEMPMIGSSSTSSRRR